MGAGYHVGSSCFHLAPRMTRALASIISSGRKVLVTELFPYCFTTINKLLRKIWFCFLFAVRGRYIHRSMACLAGLHSMKSVTIVVRKRSAHVSGKHLLSSSAWSCNVRTCPPYRDELEFSAYTFKQPHHASRNSVVQTVTPCFKELCRSNSHTILQGTLSFKQPHHASRNSVVQTATSCFKELCRSNSHTMLQGTLSFKQPHHASRNSVIQTATPCFKELCRSNSHTMLQGTLSFKQPHQVSSL